jgi:hypothetical protein
MLLQEDIIPLYHRSQRHTLQLHYIVASIYIINISNVATINQINYNRSIEFSYDFSFNPSSLKFKESNYNIINALMNESIKSTPEKVIQ